MYSRCFDPTLTLLQTAVEMKIDPEGERKEALALAKISDLQKLIADQEAEVLAAQAENLTTKAGAADMENDIERLKTNVLNVVGADQYEVTRVVLINLVGRFQETKNILADCEESLKACQTRLDDMKKILVQAQEIVVQTQALWRMDSSEEIAMQVQALEGMVSRMNDAAARAGLAV